MRLVVPWALLAMMPITFLLPGWLYQTAFWCQAAFYLLGLLGLMGLSGLPGRLTGAAASFMVLNSASWVAFWVWISGQAGKTWGKQKASVQCSVFSVQLGRQLNTEHRTLNAEH